MKAVRATAPESQTSEASPPLLGDYTPLAEDAWMGSVQASEVLEPLHADAPRWQVVVPRLPLLRLAGMLMRELSIAQASVILMASFFLSALMAAVRQVLFNAHFGTSPEASAYYAAFRLPDMLFNLIAGGALSSAMIPVWLSATREEGEHAGWQLTHLVLTTLLAVVALLVLIGEIFAPAFVTTLLAPGFDARTSQLTVTLTRVMLVQPLILTVASVATAVLNSQNQFLLTALSVASHNIAPIAGIAVAWLYPELGIYGPTFGVVGGAVLQVLILLPGLLGRGYHYWPTWNLADRRLREVIRLLIPNGLCVGVSYAGFILDTAFASKAPEDAALPAIMNAGLLLGLPTVLLGQAVGQSVFPRLAAHATALEWVQMRRTLAQTLAAVIALALPASLALIFLGRPTIHVLFEHGRFDAAAGTLTYKLLAVYAVALPAYVSTEVITRALIALRDTRTPLLINCAQLAGRAAIIMLLLDKVGVVAIPVALAVTAPLETVVLGIVLLFNVQYRISGS